MRFCQEGSLFSSTAQFYRSQFFSRTSCSLNSVNEPFPTPPVKPFYSSFISRMKFSFDTDSFKPFGLNVNETFCGIPGDVSYPYSQVSRLYVFSCQHTNYLLSCSFSTTSHRHRHFTPTSRKTSTPCLSSIG